MTRRLALLPLTLCAVALYSCTTAGARPEALGASIERVVAASPVKHALWGIQVEDDAGRVLYAHDGDRLMIPASNRKLFSAATDVECLGRDARLVTELWLAGRNVVIRGAGDPSFASARRESPGFAPFVAALRERGVTSVADVVADVSRFDRVTIPGSWKYGNLGSDYAAPVDALAVDENVSGDHAVADAAVWAAASLRDALVLGGIRVEGSVRVLTSGGPCGTESPCARVAAVESPTVGELLTVVLKNSHNLYAEMLYKRSSASGSYDEAESLERQFIKGEVLVDPAQFHFVDGSGLAPDDLVTPAAIVKILHWMNRPSSRGFWWALLPQPGGEGTLRRRLPELASRMRGKTGTINGVNAISGIVASRKGDSYRYFSVILNHHLADSTEAQDALDAVVEKIADF